MNTPTKQDWNNALNATEYYRVDDTVVLGAYAPDADLDVTYQPEDEE